MLVAWIKDGGRRPPGSLRRLCLCSKAARGWGCRGYLSWLKIFQCDPFLWSCLLKAVVICAQADSEPLAAYSVTLQRISRQQDIISQKAIPLPPPPIPPLSSTHHLSHTQHPGVNNRGPMLTQRTPLYGRMTHR